MAERERIGASPDGERHSSGRLEELSDLELVEAMRAADERAFEEFVRRFQLVVLIQARRFRIEASERRQWVTEVLYQAGMALSRRRTPAYGSVVAYLVTVCKRKCLADRRALVARERLEAECTGPLGSDNGEQAVLSLCSEATMRATYGAEWEPEGLPPILARFVSMLGDSMCEEDQRLLAWVGQRVPYSEIAAWLGLTRSAAVKRVTRLRARLLQATVRVIESLDRGDRSELIRFLRRARALDEADLAKLEASPQRQSGRAGTVSEPLGQGRHHGGPNGEP